DSESKTCGPRFSVRASISELGRRANANGTQPRADDPFIEYGFDENRECGWADRNDYRRSFDGGDRKAWRGTGNDSDGTDDEVRLGRKNDSRADCEPSEADATACRVDRIQRTHAERGVWRRQDRKSV